MIINTSDIKNKQDESGENLTERDMNMKISFVCHGTDLARTATVVWMVLATVWGGEETLQL